MYFLILGVALLLLKYFEIGFVANWAWWQTLIPFGLALVWWFWADTTGYTKRKQMDLMDEKKKSRIERQREALGFKPRRR